MTLHARVSRIDDYAGELTQALEKLQIEKSRGMLDRKQQADFLLDLKKAMEVRDLSPMRNRALFDVALAVLIAALAALVPRVLKVNHPLLLAMIAASAFSLAMSVWRFNLFLRRRHHDLTWLHHLEATVKAGGTIFD